MKKNLRAGNTLLATLMSFGLVACTTQEATPNGSGGSTVPAGTGGTNVGAGGNTGAVSGLGTLCSPPLELITDFAYTPSDAGASTTAPRFGSSGSLQGGGSFYPDTLKSDITQNSWHFTGTVNTYAGFGLYFDLCDRVDASAFKGISFTVSGNVPSITFGVGTVSDTPTGTWMLSPGGKTSAKATDSGRCTPNTPPAGSTYSQYYHPGCGDPTTQIPVTSTSAPQAVNWAQLTGGTPDASVTPSEITSIYWFFPWTDTTAPYALDFTIDDLKFIK